MFGRMLIAFMLILFLTSFSSIIELKSNSGATAIRKGVNFSSSTNVVFDFSHDVTWYDYDKNYYHATAKVNYDDVFSSRLNKRNLNLNNWREFYKNIFNFDKNKLESIYNFKR